MAKPKNLNEVDDFTLDLNESNVKKLGKDKDEGIIRPTLKGAMYIKSFNESQRSKLDVKSIESRLMDIARERKKEDKAIAKAKEREDKKGFSDILKKSEKRKKKQLKMMFADEDREVEETNEAGETIITKKSGFKNKLVKNTEGTILDTTLGKRFSPIYQRQLEEVEFMDGLINNIKEDIEKSPVRNMYRSSQTSNLLSALSHKRALIKDMMDVAKSMTDFELKHAKEARASKDGDEKDTSVLVARIGANLVKGIYDDDKEFKKKKKKKEEDEDFDYKSEKKKAKETLAMRAAKSIILSDYEKNIDIEGDYEIAVLADGDEPKDDWKFIIIDKHGERMKKWEKERPELLPSKKLVKMKFMVEKLKAQDTVTRRTYKLILN